MTVPFLRARRIFVSLSVFCVGLGLAVCGSAQDSVTLKTQDLRTKNLSYMIRAQHGAQGIQIDAFLTNKGKVPVTVYWNYPSLHHLEIVHQTTGKQVAVQPMQPASGYAPFASDRRDFKTIRPGATIDHLSILGRWNGNRAFFREPGSYVIRSTFRTSTTRERDSISGAISVIDNAWSGELRSEPITIDIPAEPKIPIAASPIQGCVLREDGQPLENALIELHYSTMNGTAFDWRGASQWDLTRSDRLGRFAFDVVPDGFDFQLVARDDHSLRGSKVLTYAEAKQNNFVTIEMPKHVMARGQVMDALGQPLADVRVDGDQGLIAYTNREGKFVIPWIDKGESTSNRFGFWQQGRTSASMSVDLATAISDKWTVVMELESATTIVGRAIFYDGTPVANAKLEVDLFDLKKEKEADANQTDPSKADCHLQSPTDNQGSFRFILPSRDSYRATIVAKLEGQEGTSSDWTQEISRLALGSEPLRLIFDNRGSVVLGIFGVPKSSYCPAVDLRLSSKRTGQFVKSRCIPLSKFESLQTFEGLDPGQYVIEVSLRNLGIAPQRAHITIPNEEPYSAKAKIQFPPIAWGSLKAQFLLPERSVAARHEIHVFTASGFSCAPTTDENGQMTLDRLPVGEYWIAPLKSDKLSSRPIVVRIRPDQCTDLGTVRWKTIDEDFGRVQGTITLDGGGEIGKVRLSGLADASMCLRPFGFRNMDLMHCKDGQFNEMLPVGQTHIIFEFLGNRHADSSAFSGESQLIRELVWNVEVMAGTSSHRDFSLPQRSECRDITVTWAPKMNRPRVAIVSPKRDGVFWLHRLEDLRTTHPPKLDMTESAVSDRIFFSNYPQREYYAIAQSQLQSQTHSSSPLVPSAYFAVQHVRNDDAATQVHFDDRAYGILKVRAMDSESHPLKAYHVALYAEFDTHSIFVAEYEASGEGELTSLGDSSVLLEMEDLLVFPKLGPGNYKIVISNQRERRGDAELSDSRWSHRIDFEIGDREQVVVNCRIDSGGKLIDVAKNQSP